MYQQCTTSCQFVCDSPIVSPICSSIHDQDTEAINQIKLFMFENKLNSIKQQSQTLDYQIQCFFDNIKKNYELSFMENQIMKKCDWLRQQVQNNASYAIQLAVFFSQINELCKQIGSLRSQCQKLYDQKNNLLQLIDKWRSKQQLMSEKNKKQQQIILQAKEKMLFVQKDLKEKNNKLKNLKQQEEYIIETINKYSMTAHWSQHQDYIKTVIKIKDNQIQLLNTKKYDRFKNHTLKQALQKQIHNIKINNDRLRETIAFYQKKCIKKQKDLVFFNLQRMISKQIASQNNYQKQILDLKKKIVSKSIINQKQQSQNQRYKLREKKYFLKAIFDQIVNKVMGHIKDIFAAK